VKPGIRNVPSALRTAGLAGAFVALLLTGAARAGLDVTLDLEHETCLQYEAVVAIVTVHNDTDSSLVIHKKSASRLFFVIERKRDELVSMINDEPPVRRLAVDPDETGRVLVDISRLYDVAATGRYFVRAVITRNGQRSESGRKVLKVVQGLELASVTKSVPGYADLDRTYKLRYWVRKDYEHLFLCVDEKESRLNYGVFELGRLVRVTEPLLEVDRKGNVIVVHQNGKDSHTRSVFKSERNGVTFVDQTYHLPDGKPYPFLRRRGAEE